MGSRDDDVANQPQRDQTRAAAASDASINKDASEESDNNGAPEEKLNFVHHFNKRMPFSPSGPLKKRKTQFAETTAVRRCKLTSA